MQVGAVTGIQARCVWRVNESTSARVALRVGTTGVDLEVGGTQRISEFSTAGLAVAVGLYVSAQSPLIILAMWILALSKFPHQHRWPYRHRWPLCQC